MYHRILIFALHHINLSGKSGHLDKQSSYESSQGACVHNTQVPLHVLVCHKVLVECWDKNNTKNMSQNQQLKVIRKHYICKL